MNSEFQEMERQALAMAEGAAPETRAILQKMAINFKALKSDAPKTSLPRWPLWIALGFAIYFVVAYILSLRNDSIFVPKGKIVINLIGPFQKEGILYTVTAFQVARINYLADAYTSRGSSPVVLYENETPLGKPYSTLDDISALGLGRYLHLKDAGIIFSSSDNTDPNTNGRKYWAVVP